MAVDELDCEGALACGCGQFMLGVKEGTWLKWNAPTDLLPTMAIFLCFCCGDMVVVMGVVLACEAGDKGSREAGYSAM